MKRFWFVYFILTSIACKCQDADDIIFSFNRHASSSFKEKYITSKEVLELEVQRRCFLEKTIVQHLDYLNNYSMSVVDSFYVRTFYSGVGGFHFSFAATTKAEFYFFYVPQFEEYLYETRYYSEVNGMQLKDTVGNYIVELSTSLIDDFIR